MKAICRLIISMTMLLVLAGSVSAYISNYPPHSFVNGPYPKIDLKLLVSWDRPFLNVSKDGRVYTKIENDGKNYKLIIEDGGFRVYYHGEQISVIPPLIDVYGGDLDRNGMDDFVIIRHSIQMGIPLEGASTTILLKVSPSEYRQIEFPSVFPGPEDFVDIDHDGKCEVIISGFYYGERYNYFTYSIYGFNGYELINADDKYKGFPKFVWFSNEPNDVDTTKLSEKVRDSFIKKQQEEVIYLLINKTNGF